MATKPGKLGINGRSKSIHEEKPRLVNNSYYLGGEIPSALLLG
ncbi:hypothetical protein [Okeania sp. SIO3I5]|nr:hypothetical protein [Okeania sp. SIO3I5]